MGLISGFYGRPSLVRWFVCGSQSAQSDQSIGTYMYLKRLPSKRQTAVKSRQIRFDFDGLITES